jgi:hypothetical protein
LPDGDPFVILEERNIFPAFPQNSSSAPTRICTSTERYDFMKEKEFGEEIERVLSRPGETIPGRPVQKNHRILYGKPAEEV